MRVKSLRRKLITVFFTLCAIVLFAVNALLVWVVTGPRSLELITPYIENALSATDGSYNIRIGSSELSWDGWHRPIGLHIKDVKIGDAKNAPMASFPDIGIRFSIFKLLIGRIDVESVELNGPVLLLRQADDGAVSLGFLDNGAFEKEPAQVAEPRPGPKLSEALAIFASDKGDTPLTRLKSISIRHGRIAIRNNRSGVFLRSRDAALDIRRIWGTAEGSLSLPLEYGARRGMVKASFTVNGNDRTIRATTEYDTIAFTLLRELFPAQEWMKSADISLSGHATMRANFEGHVESLEFLADAGEGAFEYPEQFEEKLKIKRIHLEGELSDSFKALKLKSGLLDFDKVTLAFNGFFRREGEDYAIDAAIDSAHIPISELRHYWPKALAPHTRSWVIERITKGEVEKARVDVHFKPGELKQKNTPKDAINALLDIKGASVLYMPKNPPVREVVGQVHFTGSSMDAKISVADYLTATKVTSAIIDFPDLNQPDVKMFLDVNVNTPAKDVQAFLALPSLNKAKKLNLTPEITGKATGNAKLDFIAFSEHEQIGDVPDINYVISATLEKVSQPKFLGKHDVADADMKVELNNKEVKASGKASINELPMTIVAESKFDEAHTTRYAIQTSMPVTRMPDFGLPRLDWLKGSMGVDAVFDSTDTTDTANAKLDLTRTAINLTDHGYIKKEGEKARLELDTQHLQSGNTSVPRFSLSGAGYEAAGKAEFEKGTGEISTISFDGMTMGKHDLERLEYTKTPYGMQVYARGNALDLTPYMAKSGKGGKQPGIVADIKVDTLILGDKAELQKVTATLDCPDICDSASVTGILADKTPVIYVIKAGQLDSQCDNAGELLRVLGVYEGMQGGKLSLKGQYQGKKLVGKAFIKDFTLKNAPVLTKIFTITSLTGILDTLTGKGIEFDKMVAPYEYEHGNIVLKDAKQYGSAIGITASGAISMPDASYDLSGTLVPSYTLNSLVGKIPLLGDIIVGGDGKGLIALNYSVKGPMDNPSVSANPLSVLTPGILRGVFDIFDKPAPSLEQMKAEQKKKEKSEKK